MTFPGPCPVIQSCKLLFLKAQFPDQLSQDTRLPASPVDRDAPSIACALGAWMGPGVSAATGRAAASTQDTGGLLSLPVTALHLPVTPSQLSQPHSICPVREQRGSRAQPAWVKRGRRPAHPSVPSSWPGRGLTVAVLASIFTCIYK